MWNKQDNTKSELWANKKEKLNKIITIYVKK